MVGNNPPRLKSAPDILETHWERFFGVLLVAALVVFFVVHYGSDYRLISEPDVTVLALLGAGLGAAIAFALSIQDYVAQLQSVRADHPISVAVISSGVATSEDDKQSENAICDRRSVLRFGLTARLAVSILAGMSLARIRGTPPTERQPLVIAGSGTILEALKASGVQATCESKLLLLNAGSMRGMETVLNQDDWSKGAAVMATRLNGGTGSPSDGGSPDPLFKGRYFVEAILGKDSLLFLANSTGAPTYTGFVEGPQPTPGRRYALFDHEKLTTCLTTSTACYPSTTRTIRGQVNATRACANAKWYYPRSCKGRINDSGTCREFSLAFLDGREIVADVASDRRDANVSTIPLDVQAEDCAVGLSSQIGLHIAGMKGNINRVSEVMLLDSNGDFMPNSSPARGLYVYLPALPTGSGGIALTAPAREIAKCLFSGTLNDWIEASGAQALAGADLARLGSALQSSNILEAGLHERQAMSISNGTGEVYFIKESAMSFRPGNR